MSRTTEALLDIKFKSDVLNKLDRIERALEEQGLTIKQGTATFEEYLREYERFEDNETERAMLEELS
jgi:hypothetical protein